MKIIKSFVFIATLLIFSVNAFAKMEIDVEVQAKEKRKIPICIVKFKNIDKTENLEQINKDIFNIIVYDLKFSNNFKVTTKDDSGFLNFALPNNFLKTFNKAEFVINGEIGTMLDNQIFIKVKIFDLFLKQTKLYKNYYGGKNLYRRLAHRISNEILKKLTGEKGIFEDKILFVSKRNGNKSAYLMDYDGKGLKSLLNNDFINISPKIYKNYLYFTSFESGRSRVYVKNLKTGKVKLLIKKGDFSAGADINPNGTKIVAMFEQGGDSEIGIFDIYGNLIKQITRNIFNESSPVWSHDGTKIAYVSNRTGTPQIYIYNVEKNFTKRLTFTSRYCAYPNWGPDDTYLYFASMVDGRFKICRMSVGEMHYEQLTFGDYSEEFPSISSDGQYLLFTRKIGYVRQIFMLNIESGKVIRITNDKFDNSYPMWYRGKY